MCGTRGYGNAAASALVGVALALSLAACGGDKPAERRAQRTEIVPDTTQPAADTFEAAGDVVIDAANAPVKERWITDANAFSLFGTMNARQIAAADVELEGWHVDAVRAFAAAIAREHAELQHSADSLASRLGITPVTPALAKPWSSRLQTQIDSMRQVRPSMLDRAFLRQQVSSHQLMADYVQQLAAAAERPEVRSFFAAAATRISSQLARARSLQATFAPLDSAAADSAARRAARQRKPSPTGR
jgi:predicted outer membrane protein